MAVVFADLSHHLLKPLTWTRSVLDIEVGGATLGEQTRSRLPVEQPVDVFVPAYLRDLTALNDAVYELDRRIVAHVEAGTTLVNPAAVPDDDIWAEIESLEPGTVLVDGGLPVALTVAESVDNHERLLELLDSYEHVRLDGDTLGIVFPWDLDRVNGRLLTDGIEPSSERQVDADVEVLGTPEDIVIGDEVTIGPNVVFDTREGPIRLGDGVEVNPNSRIEGPAHIGASTHVGAGENAVIHGDTHVGAVCRVGGEVGSLVVHSFTNKYHYGFLGHAVLGSWVNVGAGTTNSDLKNTYGTVTVTHPSEGEIEAGRKVGTTVSDHVRFGIQTAIDTGKQIGPCCSLVGRIDDNIAPFTWRDDEGIERYRTDQATTHVTRMIERREEYLPEGYGDAQAAVVRELSTLLGDE